MYCFNNRIRVLYIIALFIGISWNEGFAAEEISISEIKPDNVLEYSLSVIEPLESRFSQLPTLHFMKGYAYYRAQKYQDAIDAFKKGLEIRTDYPDITQMVAFLYSKLNEHEKSVEWYKKTVEQDPEAFRAYKRLGQELEKLNRNDEAMEAYKREIENYPDDASSYVYLGELYFDRGELERAKEQARIAMEKEPIIPEPHYLLAKIYRQEGKKEEAEKSLKIFRQKKEEEQEYIEKEKEKEEPIEEQKAAFNSATQVHMELALLFSKLNKKEEAKKHYRKVISLTPKNVAARYQLAKIYQSQQQFENAEIMFRELIAIDKDDPRFLNGLGNLLGLQKEWKEALRYFEQALRLDEDSITAKRGIAMVYLNTAQNPSKALSLMEDVVSEKNDAENYDLLGWAYFANGMLERSLDAMETAIQLDPTNPVYKRRHAQIKARMR